ncbi:reverse transcriptase domain-containing protein [Tanacetum coccineum]
MQQEKVHQEKLKAVKARLNFEEVSRHSESRTPRRRRDLRKGLRSKRVRNISGRDKEKGMSAYSNDSRHQSYHISHRDTKSCYQSSRSKRTEITPKRRHHVVTKGFSESEDSEGGHWKSRSKRQRSSVEDNDLSQPWTEHSTMPTWCHMFNSTLTRNARVWFDDLPPESIDSYDDLKKAFLENYLQQKKCIKDPVEIHHIKQRDRESTEEFVRRYKLLCRDVKGAPECMKISGFMHGITNPELIKRLHDKIPKSVDEMIRVTTTFLRCEVAASNHERKKSFSSWKQQEAGHKQTSRNEAFETNKGPSESRIEANRGDAQSRKAVTFNQGAKTKQWERSGKGSKKGGSLKKEQTIGNPDGTSMAEGEEDGTKGPMIIEAEIGGHFVYRMYVDGGSSSEILYGHCFNRFCPEVKSQMVPAATPLVTISIQRNHRKARSKEDPCNLIHSSRNDIIYSDRWNGHITEQQDCPTRVHNGLKTRNTTTCSTLTEEGRTELRGLLRHNLDIFAWKPVDMTGVPRYIAEHMLNICEGFLPIRQKKRGQAPERNKAIYKEVESCWRMCVDFKDLNKACPKDGYQLPEIDWKVESLCEYPFKCFLDAYKGYHQIKMAKEDEEKTAFITSQGILCYSKMPFGLKNAGATYQRLVDKAFQKQISRNLKVYVDDLVIKSRTEQEVIRDIEETFKTLSEIDMKLNPKKCTFGMREGTFLRYKVNTDGLKVCPDKLEAVLSLPSPKGLKDVQRLNGKLASLNRFMSTSGEKSLPFFKTLKKCTKKSNFQKTVEAETAFKQIKKSIAELPMLTSPKEKEELIIYLAVVKKAISAVLMMERDGKQVPIYFVSRALQGPEINYSLMEKLILALRPKDDPLDTPMEDKEELPDP